jgi:hypothetical protein
MVDHAHIYKLQPKSFNIMLNDPSSFFLPQLPNSLHNCILLCCPMSCFLNFIVVWVMWILCFTYIGN